MSKIDLFPQFFLIFDYQNKSWPSPNNIPNNDSGKRPETFPEKSRIFQVSESVSPPPFFCVPRQLWSIVWAGQHTQQEDYTRRRIQGDSLTTKKCSPKTAADFRVSVLLFLYCIIIFTFIVSKVQRLYRVSQKRPRFSKIKIISDLLSDDREGKIM